jgi:hypothetical protein
MLFLLYSCCLTRLPHFTAKLLEIITGHHRLTGLFLDPWDESHGYHH